MPPSLLAKNTAYFTLALTAQKVLSFIYFAFIARMVGGEEVGIGKYVFVLAFTTIFGLFIDFGMQSVLIREIAKEKTKAQAFLSTVLTYKVLVGFLVYIAAIAAISFSGKDTLTRDMVMISGIIMVIDSLTLTLFAVFRGFQNLKYEAIAAVAGKIIAMAAGAGALWAGYGLRALIAAVLASSVFMFFFALYHMIRTFHIIPKIHFEMRVFRGIIIMAIPFGIASALVTAYGYFDTILLSFLAGDRYVGWYSVANKLTYALQFIPAAFAAALFPALAAYYISSKELLTFTFERAMFYLMIVAVPISLGSVLLAEPLILKVYGPAFEASIPALQILMCGLLVIFLNFPVGYLLNATNRQTINTINIGITLACNIVLNIMLIPEWNFIGASIANLCSAILLFFLGLFQVGRVIPYSKKHLLKVLGKSIVAAAGMGAVIVLWTQNLSISKSVDFLFLMFLAAITYALLLLLVGGVRKEDINKIYQAIAKRVAS